MSLSFFYTDNLSTATLILSEDTSKHIIGVLRMTIGEKLQLTDGKGTKATAVITDDNRKRCTVRVEQTEIQEPPAPSVTIAISIIKNASRFEWFLEKATEIGVTEIIPILCSRTEKEKFRHDRMQGILVSAMLQSQQSWLPVLHEPTTFEMVIKNASQQTKLIAHCLPDTKQSLSHQLISTSANQLICIGPEGDFTPAEIQLALESGFQPVALGSTRLRTETAGVVAATLLRLSAG